jgi:uncharacterized protein (DUF433 family)
MTATIERELYTVADAARILRMPPSTLQWWLEGRGTHPPVIRVRPTGSRAVTWGEFVEAGFLRAYRTHGVPLPHIREFVDLLRDKLQVPYPLAHAKPLIGGRNLVMEAQRSADLDGHPLIYEAVSGQYVFSAPLEVFIERIDFDLRADEEPWALRIHPVGRESPVVIDPDYSFGAPTVAGIRTEILAELVDAGDTPEDIAEDYGIDIAVVKAATAYEWSAYEHSAAA